MREVGISEEDVQRRRDATCLSVPITRAELEEPLKPGTERMVIDSLKELYTLMKENRELFEPMYRHLMAQRNAKN